jgi:hypothetical protein
MLRSHPLLMTQLRESIETRLLIACCMSSSGFSIALEYPPRNLSDYAGGVRCD